MTYEAYKWLHLLGVFITLSGLSTYIVLRKTGQESLKSWKLIGVISHGVGLVIILVTGFGQMAKLGITSNIPVWIFAKIVIWLLVGALWSAIKRRTDFAAFYALTLTLFSAAAYLAILKPLN